MNQQDIPELSIVIPVYNGESFLVDCLNSVRRETENIAAEIICVDDCSTDNSVHLLLHKFSDVRLLRNHANKGFAPTCNRGLAVARGRYIFLLNQDTRLCAGALLALMRKASGADEIDDEINSVKPVGFVGPRFVGFDGRLQKKCSSFPTFTRLFFTFSGLSYMFPDSSLLGGLAMSWFDHLQEREVDQPMGAALMFKRELLEKIGSLDESFPMFFNDVDWARRAVAAGYRNLYFPSATVEHFVGGSTRPLKSRMIGESHRSLYRYLVKWNPGASHRPVLFFWRIILALTGLLRSWSWRLRSLSQEQK